MDGDHWDFRNGKGGSFYVAYFDVKSSHSPLLTYPLFNKKNRKIPSFFELKHIFVHVFFFVRMGCT